jgi:hypothetical protein
LLDTAAAIIAEVVRYGKGKKEAMELIRQSARQRVKQED